MSNVSLSFEFFPPKTEALQDALLKVAGELAPLKPSFVSVTYGAGGTTRGRTHALVDQLQTKFGLKAAAHLTCVGATKTEVDGIAKDYWAKNIKHIVALRGDAPDMNGKYTPHPEGYAYSCDLVEGLKKLAPFEISVAAYPEVHPDAVSADADLLYLKRKQEAGATRAITQFFFDNDAYLRFCERAKKIGITIPIVPGLLPISNFEKAVEFAGKCNTYVPDSLKKTFAGLLPNSDEFKAAAIATAIEQANYLRKNGVTHFHYYTLNRADLVIPICKALEG
ncbi:MAG: methylenetetrahydrofolate reductase [NAD(P)H] [Alphaproteobacteria bacterium]|nr:methylenetetrahydrofolate reductase [NAD(P)H] [Alphaproteobacteria bacterium]